MDIVKEAADCVRETCGEAVSETRTRGRRRVRLSKEYNAARSVRFKLKTSVYLGGKRYKTLKGIDTNYFISMDGHIVSYDYRFDGFTEVPLSHNGTGVSLYLHNVGSDGAFRTGRMKYYRLDRLVATAWCANPRRHAYVRHKDGNAFNCDASNLMWVAERQVDRVAERPAGLEYRMFGVRRGAFAKVSDASAGLGLSVYDVLRYANTGDALPDGGRIAWVWKKGSRNAERASRAARSERKRGRRR